MMKLQTEPAMKRTVAKTYPIVYKIILQMISNNKGTLNIISEFISENQIPVSALSLSGVLIDPCCIDVILNLHSVENGFFEMSNIDPFKKVSIPFFIHQANTKE